MSSVTEPPRSVVAALEEVARWRAEAEQRTQAEIADADQELQNVRSAIENLQRQLESLQRFRDDLSGRSDIVEDEEIQRSYDAIFSVLGDQARALAERSQRVSEAEAARGQALLETLKDSAVAPLLDEYNQFKQKVEPTLDALPESYRGVIRQHHESVLARLREHLDKVAAGPVSVDAPPLELDVAVAVDAPEGAPEVLMLVLPVAEEVQAAWESRPEDLQTRLAARVVQGVYQACVAAGGHQARCMFGGHQGLVAVEAEVPGLPGDLGERVLAALKEAFEGAAELKAAQVQVVPRLVSVDHLLPPDDPEDEEDEEVSDA